MPAYNPAALAKAAMEARKNAYAPYSGFAVGAALQADDGSIYTGCNVENAAYGLSNCAERSALFNAVSAGARHFAAIAVAGGPTGSSGPLPLCSPCGSCRQALYEFGGPSLPVVLVHGQQDYQLHTLGELLPLAFGPENLG